MRARNHFSVAVAILASSVAGCGGGSGEGTGIPDSGPAADATDAPDALAADVAAPDAPPEVDAGPSEADAARRDAAAAADVRASRCGDGVCDGDEGPADCPADCPVPTVCGDGTCDPGEDHEGCPVDCPRCGDARCEPGLGESFDACPADCPGPPANDTCEGAEQVTASGEQEASGTTALASPAAGLHWSDSPAVYYRFDLAQAGSLVVVLEADPPWDTWLHLLSGACDAAEPLASNDDHQGRQMSRVVAAALEPGPHLLVVTGYDLRDAGPFRLRLAFGATARCGDGACAAEVEDAEGCPEDCSPPPECGDAVCQPGERPEDCPQDCSCGDGECQPRRGEDLATCAVDCPAPGNDTCAAARPLALGELPAVVDGDTSRGAVDLPARCGWYQNAAPDVFYSFVLDEPRLVSATVASAGGWRAVAYLLADGCGPEAQVVACDEAVAGPQLQAPLEPGTYHLLVTGRSPDASGAFRLTVEAAAPPPLCGDDACEPPETVDDCPEDCGFWCGDGECEATEDLESCPEDCAAGECGNGVCEPGTGESWHTCWIDCEVPCGDDVCDAAAGETHARCPADCPAPPRPDHDVCGDAGALPSSGEPVAGTTLGAGRELLDAPCEGPDVFYDLTLEAASSVSLTIEAEWDACLRVLSGPCGEPGPWADRGVTGAAFDAQALEAGSHLVVVSGLRASDAGAFSLTATLGSPVICGDAECVAPAEDWRRCPVDCAPPPAPDHDACEAALVLPVDGDVVREGSTASASRDCDVCWGQGPDVFFAFELVEPAGLDLHLDSEWDGTLHLLAGSCDDPVPLADHAGGEGPHLDLHRLEAGDYRIVVGGRRAADLGAFTLRATFGAAGSCGDGRCEGEEGWRSCPEDCPRCGNGFCQRDLGEDEGTCPEDCFVADNDACERAAALPAEGEHTRAGLTRCGAAVEGAWCAVPDVFYAFTLEDAASFWVHAEADGVWYPELVLLTGACDALEPVEPDVEWDAEAAFAALAPGDYVLAVTGLVAGGGGPFVLTTAFAEPARCPDGLCSERFEDWRGCPADCPPPPPPDNDRCDAAAPILAQGEVGVDGTTAFATSEHTPHAAGSPDVFYRFSLAADALVDLVVEAEGWDPWLYLLSGTCAAPVEVASNDDDGGDLRRSRVVARVLEAGDYHVVVAGRSPEEAGDFTLDARFGEPVVCPDGVCADGYARPGPDNDLCADAAVLVVEGTTVGSTERAGHDYVPNARGGADVFYGLHLEGAASVELLLQTDGDWDVELVLLAGTCDVHEEVSRNDRFGTHTRAYLQQLSLDPGDYLVIVTGWDEDARGPFSLTVTFGDAVVCGDGECGEPHEDWQGCPQDCEAPPGPANDTCAAAEVVPASGEQQVDGTTSLARSDYVAGGRGSRDVYYAFSLEAEAGVDILLEAEDGWDTYLFLLRGACGATDEVEHNDDGEGMGDSRIRAPQLPPGDYLVVVTGYDDLDSGDFTLLLEFSDPVRCGDGVCNEDWAEPTSCPEDCDVAGPENDLCAGATPLPSQGTQEVQGTTEDAGHHYAAHDEPSPDVFYRFTLDQAASVGLAVEVDGWWLSYTYLLLGTCDDNEVVAEDMWEEGIYEGRLAAGDYLVVVAGWEADDCGDFTLSVTFGAPE